VTVAAVAFDLGGVLIDWNPRHLYRKLFDDEAPMEKFLADVCSPAWNDELDRGLPFAEGVARLVAQFPEQAALIEAYHSRWTEMVAGPIDDAVAVADELHRTGLPLYALSNWARSTYDLVAHEYPFLGDFAGVLLSGDVGVAKPDRRIFDLLCERFDLDAATTLFVDDNAANVIGAQHAGLQAVQFDGAAALRRDLVALGVLR
jgi:2-haloacid dehalogenase